MTPVTDRAVVERLEDALRRYQHARHDDEAGAGRDLAARLEQVLAQVRGRS